MGGRPLHEDYDFKEEFRAPLRLKQRAREVLRVPDNAGRKTIQQIYRKHAKAYHPDLHPDDPASYRMFLVITEAYAILTDKKRADPSHTLLWEASCVPPDSDEKEYEAWWLGRYGNLF